jgi:curved DNA-binding protein CbpA
MPDPIFRGDPYAVLDIAPASTPAEIKRRWRELAREHHPDRAAGVEQSDAARMTTRMARINAAYDLLRDPVRRARFDASPQGRRAWSAGGTRDRRARPGGPTDAASAGPEGPPPFPPARPVTARYDTTAAFRPRNATTSTRRPVHRAHPPRVRQPANGGDTDLRSSTPTGPVRRRRTGPVPRIPPLAEARATLLEFGRFHGHTLGEVADAEPTYIDWIARTITRDRDLVVRARVVQADLDDRCVERHTRPPRPGFGTARESMG